ncbi:MAG: hypothetical protein IT337_01345 [Thermomicrobiales bacterium]|nr:hypothetical protein [Thermomicrobiales bacterium]
MTEPHNRAGQLPETPHDAPFDRGKIDALLTRVRDGAEIDLLEATLDAIAWDAFAADGGQPLSPLERAELRDYYRIKWSDVGPLYLAELLSTEFMTEQRARGSIEFSPRLLELGRGDPEVWAEIRQFFRRKEIATGLLLLAHRQTPDQPA